MLFFDQPLSHGPQRARIGKLARVALNVSIRERMRLAQRLTRSINGVKEPAEDVEQLRRAVAERRQKDLRSGKLQPIGLGEVFDNARRDLGR